MTIKAIEFNTADEAIQHYYASGYGDRVILLGSKYYVTRKTEADRLDAAGIEFAYLFDDGIRTMAVPVNTKE